MSSELAALQKKRLAMMLSNLLYFLVLLVLGYLLLIRGMGGKAYAAAAVLAVYLLLLRPMTNRYKTAVREAILRRTVCRGLTDVTYEPGKGVSAEEFLASGLVNTLSEKSFLSREKVTGRKNTCAVTMADVIFPIRENGLNAMSSGLYLRLVRPGAAFPELTVRAGQTDDLPLKGPALSLLEEMAAFIPGNLYMRAGADELHLFFRGRFVGFQVNPLMNITENTLRNDPIPELQQALRLSQMLAGQGVPEKG